MTRIVTLTLALLGLTAATAQAQPQYLSNGSLVTQLTPVIGWGKIALKETGEVKGTLVCRTVSAGNLDNGVVGGGQEREGAWDEPALVAFYSCEGPGGACHVRETGIPENEPPSERQLLEGTGTGKPIERKTMRTRIVQECPGPEKAPWIKAVWTNRTKKPGPGSAWLNFPLVPTFYAGTSALHPSYVVYGEHPGQYAPELPGTEYDELEECLGQCQSEGGLPPESIAKVTGMERIAGLNGELVTAR